jgi:hypothetical protein
MQHQGRAGGTRDSHEKGGIGVSDAVCGGLGVGSIAMDQGWDLVKGQYRGSDSCD